MIKISVGSGCSFLCGSIVSVGWVYEQWVVKILEKSFSHIFIDFNGSRDFKWPKTKKSLTEHKMDTDFNILWSWSSLHKDDLKDFKAFYSVLYLYVNIFKVVYLKQ